MESFIHASSTDGDGRNPFMPLNGPDLANRILHIRHNDEKSNSLVLFIGVCGLGSIVCMRLGCILGESIYVKTLAIVDCNMNSL